MTNQQINEIIKALAYGETPQQIADAEGVTVSDVQQVQRDYAMEIDYERQTLRKVGYIHE
ncbi:hypothetical protein CAFE_01700 [Caprobacter fermentans]|uniref:Uncharacterized protein n=1 Tax=Caproicibacter fermentans TaxID=2576756 RepID=A0A6N8HUP6_9FIRM|nr:hypothetical protein [Caproicibacter fermentans]MVB09514.1 hypothetical protein [Caproicibacter fermentans]